MNPRIDLTGLDGTNPLGYLAALGTLRVAGNTWPDVRLSWSTGAVPRPSLHGCPGLDRLIEAFTADAEERRVSVALRHEGIDDVKFKSDDVVPYLAAAIHDGSIDLAGAFVAQGPLDNNGNAKPTDLHFSAGQQRFLGIADELSHTTADQFREALIGPWSYSTDASTFGWDVTDDRIYALSAFNPAKEKKLTNPGADWLGLVGLTFYPVMNGPAPSGKGRTLGAGMTGSWKRGGWAWPVWSDPLATRQVETIVSHVVDRAGGQRDVASWRRWGISRVFHAGIRRSDQGGYGSFSPTSALAEAES